MARSGYIGEVVSSERIDDTFRMKLRVIRADKVTTTREVVLTSDARTTCGVKLAIGKRYVVYGSLEGGSIYACSPIYGLEEGDPEPQLPPRPGRVEGRVSRFELEKIRDLERLEAVPGASVWIDLPSGRVSTTADGYGVFAFDDVPAGKHLIGVDAGPDLAPWMVKPIELDGPTDCADVSLVLRPSGKIAARVLDGDGRPVAGLHMVLLDANKPEAEFGDIITANQSREDGTVVFDGLNAGEYLLSINPRGHVSGDRPFPPTFYGGTSRATATRLRVGSGRSPDAFTFTLPPPLPTRRLIATVTCADGSIPPFMHAAIHDLTLPDAEFAPSFTGNTLAMPLLHDRNYLLEITASIPYGPTDVADRPRRGEELAPVQIAAGKSDVQLTVIAPFAVCAGRFP